MKALYMKGRNRVSMNATGEGTVEVMKYTIIPKDDNVSFEVISVEEAMELQKELNNEGYDVEVIL